MARPGGEEIALPRGSRLLAGLGLLVATAGCVVVEITPLGSTLDGRRQLEIDCNTRAFREGECLKEAFTACGGNFETQAVRDDGVLLVACHQQGQKRLK